MALQNRHVLCETLPYYRAYQSGAYVTRGFCLALLVDKQCGERDLISEDVVIARAYGFFRSFSSPFVAFPFPPSSLGSAEGMMTGC